MTLAPRLLVAEPSLLWVLAGLVAFVAAACVVGFALVTVVWPLLQASVRDAWRNDPVFEGDRKREALRALIAKREER